MQKNTSAILAMLCAMSLSACGSSNTTDQEEIESLRAENEVLKSEISATAETTTATSVEITLSEDLKLSYTSISIDESLPKEESALKAAKDYLECTAFSRDGLIKQLEVDKKFTHSESVYAVDNCGADWNDQALKTAQSYLKIGGVGYSGMVDQLVYVGFTSEEAAYAVDNCGADWYEQAELTARMFVDSSTPITKKELVDTLEYLGFTSDQAEYGVNRVY